MSDIAWASDVLQHHVAPTGSAQYVETRIRNAAQSLRWKFNRTRTLWYADERAIVRPREIRALEEYTGLRYGRQELAELDLLIGRADALLAGSQDKDFYSAFADGLRALAGLVDRARATRGGGK